MTNPGLNGFWSLMNRSPSREMPQREDTGDFFLTGPDLVARIVDAIKQDQSVVLEGPRGSGKSRCIREAIRQAAVEKHIFSEKASFFLQGNREIPRDYLVEDETIFHHVEGGGPVSVVPERRPAPLFAFAIRGSDGLPVVDGSDGKSVICRLDPGEKESKSNPNLSRFILFLDEINRFSDGVLDSLLSVLEEREAILSGRAFKLPVVVLMTMNPPGYDATARRLNPPLAARITRTYKLFTPDLDTLSDQIITARLRNEQRKHDVAAKASKLPNFPVCPPELLRRAALVTLCLWGVPDPKRTSVRAGLECLTPATRSLLTALSNRNPTLGQAMAEMEPLCHYGPDGRAAADWLATAIGYAVRQEKERPSGKPVVLTREHLHSTLIETVANKIYDAFSPASRPDQTRKKNRLLKLIAHQILDGEAPRFDDPDIPPLVRIVDQDDELSRRFKPVLKEDAGIRFQQLLVSVGLTANTDVGAFTENAGGATPAKASGWAGALANVYHHSAPDHTIKALVRALMVHKLVINPGTVDDQQIQDATGDAASTDRELSEALKLHALGWAKPSFWMFAEVLGARFMLTNKSFASLQNDKMPEQILAKIKDLKDKEFGQEEFLAELADKLAKNELETWRKQILNHALLGEVLTGSNSDRNELIALGCATMKKEVQDHFRALVKVITSVVPPARDTLARYESVCLISRAPGRYKGTVWSKEFTPDQFMDICDKNSITRRHHQLILGEFLEQMWTDPRYQRYDSDDVLKHHASEFFNEFNERLEDLQNTQKINAQKCLKACISRLQPWVSWRGGVDAQQHLDVMDEVFKKLP